MTQSTNIISAQFFTDNSQIGQLRQSAAINSAPSFISAGSVITPISVGSGNVAGKIVKVLADGKVLVVGQGGNDYNSGNVVLTRYNNDGSLDTTFSDDGILVSTLGNAIVQSVTELSGGKVSVIARSTESSNPLNFALLTYNNDGSINTDNATGNYLLAAKIGSATATDFALLRYININTLDSSFGTNGAVVTNISTFDSPTVVANQTDGKILVGGSAGDGTTGDFALVRYNTDGSLDTSFDSDGKLTTDFNGKTDSILSVAVQTDGKILAVGVSGNSSTNSYNAAVARYNTDGSLDTSFSNDGKLTYNLGANSDFGESVTLQVDGKILIAGNTLNRSNGSYDFSLVRLNTDGTLDTSFGKNGVVTTPVSVNNDFAYSVTVKTDGKILITGGSNIDANNANSKLTLVRYNSDGTLDNTFLPVNTLDGNPTYFLNGSPVVMDNNVAIRDSELDAADDYNGASITLGREGGGNNQDLFTRSGSLVLLNDSVLVDGVPVGKYSSSKITFNSYATTSKVNSVLQQLAYSSTATTSSNVKINWVFDDGSSGTVTGSVNINIVAGTDDTSIAVSNLNGDTKTGTDKNDTITGNKGKDVLSGGLGNDSLYGLAGNDKLNGNDGDDYLDGGVGANILSGGAGNDTYIVSGKGNKIIEAKESGTDLVVSNISFTLAANLENLSLTGLVKLSGTGNALANIIYGNEGSNNLTGKAGNDRLYGGLGNDNLNGDAGTDVLFGEDGNDRLFGGADNDYLIGGIGNDILSGGAGRDLIYGGTGKDKLTGGKGADEFSFADITDTGINKQSWDVITDFIRSQGDKIDLSSIDANSSDNAFTYIGETAFSADATGQLRFDAKSHVLYGSTDADTDAEFAIQLMGVKSLLASDFIL